MENKICKHDIKESEGNMFNPIFKDNLIDGNDFYAYKSNFVECIIHKYEGYDNISE